MDPRLAAGVTPASGPLLAVRATQLTDPRRRRSLADAWDEVVVRAANPGGVLDPRVPVPHDVVHVSAEIAELAQALRSDGPVAARDVARARELLTDGTSPVYSGARSLPTAVAQLVSDLNFARR